MIYCLLKENSVQLLTANINKIFYYVPKSYSMGKKLALLDSDDGLQDENSESEEDPEDIIKRNKEINTSLFQKFDANDFSDFLRNLFDEISIRKESSKITFILDYPWCDVRFIELPPHKKGKSRQILAFNLSSEFTYEMEDVIFDFYTLPQQNDKKTIRTIVYSCRKVFSEMLNTLCINCGLTHMGSIPYNHILENSFSSSNKNIVNHIHLEIEPTYARFFKYENSQYNDVMGTELTGIVTKSLEKIKQRLNMLIVNSPDDVTYTIDKENSKFYSFFDDVDTIGGDEIITDSMSFSKIDGLMSVMMKKKRTLNLTRIQNPFLLDILRAKKQFMKVAICFAGVVMFYLAFQGIVSYQRGETYKSLESSFISQIKKTHPQLKSVSTAVTTLGKETSEMREKWEFKQQFAYRTYTVSNFLKKMTEIFEKNKNNPYLTLKYDEEYIEYTGEIENLSQLNDLQQINEEMFPNNEVEAEQKNINNRIVYTLKVKKVQSSDEEL